MPERVQLRRVKGWRKAPDTIVVARPTKWGNPFAIGEPVPREARRFLVDPVHGGGMLASLMSLDKVWLLTAEQAVTAHAWWLIEQPHLMLALGELRGHDLACWCALSRPCHADTLLELANSGLSPGDVATVS